MLVYSLFAPFFLATKLAVHAETVSVPIYSTVPSTASPPIPTSLGYRLQSFGHGAYMVTDGTYQSLFFVACESVIAIDAPPTIGKNLVRAIRSVTSKPISHIVYSHHHADHIGGAYLLGSSNDITIISHKLTADELAMSQDYKHRPAPTITFDNTYILRVCNQTIQLDYRGPNHDPGNIFIYAPYQKILMLVDIVYPGWIPFNILAESQSIPGFIRAHDQLLTYDFDHYVGGHLNLPGRREDVLIQREYIRDLFNTSVLAIQMSAQTNNSISFPSVIGPAASKADPNNPWASFGTYIDVLARYVSAELEPRWSSKLYGYDVFGESHAATMLESVRIDYGTLGPFGVTNA